MCERILAFVAAPFILHSSSLKYLNKQHSIKFKLLAPILQFILRTKKIFFLLLFFTEALKGNLSSRIDFFIPNLIFLLSQQRTSFFFSLTFQYHWAPPSHIRNYVDGFEKRKKKKKVVLHMWTNSLKTFAMINNNNNINNNKIKIAHIKLQFL